eukprot:TRINITY_DN8157_c0_g1_i5.p1 TRINITY_DN8157_c0_g1~~TRINITY_DN8157_c0_g1_i5.p1  ORF type:complete len:187 (+),score=6.96 TRINITY_DN8157_c0_g1_i5:416-976(+)
MPSMWCSRMLPLLASRYTARANSPALLCTYGLVFIKAQGSPPVYWIVCQCADKPPRERSATHPEAQRRAVASTGIKCECKWHVKLRQQSVSKQQHTAPNENSCQNASHLSLEPPWVLSHLTSFHEGHNITLSAMIEPVAQAANSGRIITREDLTDDIQNVRNWSATSYEWQGASADSRDSSDSYRW